MPTTPTLMLVEVVPFPVPSIASIKLPTASMKMPANKIAKILPAYIHGHYSST